MAEWHEEDHPRDDDGKFTYKNGGYSLSEGGVLEGKVEKTDKDGRGKGGGIGDKIGKVGSAIGNALMAVLNSQAIPALLNLLAAKYSADELNKLKEILYSQAARNEAAGNIDPRVQAGREEKEKMQNRADVLYGNDEEYNKKYHPEKLLPQEEEMTNGVAANNQHSKEYIERLQSMSETNSDKSFLNDLKFILKAEGGYNNIKGDVPTNFGITQGIYNIYRKEINLPVQSVQKIKIEEVVPIYYKYFWKPSGAEKLPHPLDLVYFDMYVNSNPRDAKNVLNRSNNDVYQFIENRRKFYDDVIKAKPIKAKFRNGWNNRLDALKQYVDEYYSNNGNANDS